MPGDDGYFICDSGAGEVSRMLRIANADSEKLADGAYRCSGTFRQIKVGSAFLIGLTPSQSVGPYSGDGKSGAVLRKLDIVEVPNSY